MPKAINNRGKQLPLKLRPYMTRLGKNLHESNLRELTELVKCYITETVEGPSPRGLYSPCVYFAIIRSWGNGAEPCRHRIRECLPSYISLHPDLNEWEIAVLKKISDPVTLIKNLSEFDKARNYNFTEQEEKALRSIFLTQVKEIKLEDEVDSINEQIQSDDDVIEIPFEVIFSKLLFYNYAHNY